MPDVSRWGAGMSLIAARDLNVSYRQNPVLENVSFAIEPGEIVTVVGPNGSGKSTLIRALLGVVQPQSGTVQRQPGLHIGYVPQKLSIEANMPMTVARFLSLPHRQTPADMAAACEKVGAQGLMDRQMTNLSGGQFQRVLLARALLGKPEILILDEPTQGLDQPGVASFYQLIENVSAATVVCAVLLVSHDLHVVMSASDRVICLNGHVCCEGAPEIVSEAPEYQALFGIGTGWRIGAFTGTSMTTTTTTIADMTMLDDFVVRAALAGVGLSLATGPLGGVRCLATHGLFQRYNCPCGHFGCGPVAGVFPICGVGNACCGIDRWPSGYPPVTAWPVHGHGSWGHGPCVSGAGASSNFVNSGCPHQSGRLSLRRHPHRQPKLTLMLIWTGSGLVLGGDPVALVAAANGYAEPRTCGVNRHQT